MADLMRWAYGDTNPVLYRVDSAEAIAIGDLVWQNTDAAEAADQITADSLINMQDAFVDNFVGVAMQRSRVGDTALIRVATTGTFEFICASATFTEAARVGVAGTADVALANQTVIGVSAVVSAIGVVPKAYATAVTAVLVQINSTKFTGGLPAATASS